MDLFFKRQWQRPKAFSRPEKISHFAPIAWHVYSIYYSTPRVWGGKNWPEHNIHPGAAHKKLDLYFLLKKNPHHHAIIHHFRIFTCFVNFLLPRLFGLFIYAIQSGVLKKSLKNINFEKQILHLPNYLLIFFLSFYCRFSVQRQICNCTLKSTWGRPSLTSVPNATKPLPILVTSRNIPGYIWE